MGDFFTPPSGYPEVPPEPKTPLPDFETIGSTFTFGMAKAAGQLSWLQALGDWLLEWVAKLIGFLLSLLLRIFAYMIKIMSNVTDEASAGYGAIVAATLHELFGVQVNPAAVNTRAGGDERKAVAAALGQAIIGTLFSATPTNPAGGIPPSDAAANNFLRVVMNMELNGWLESWFADAATYHLLEKYGDLKDGIAHVLGLGRLSRQVFAPPLKVLVHDPYLALLNQKYRPKGVDVNTVMRAFHRGDVDRNALSTLLGNQGYSEKEIDWLVVDHQKFIPNEDVDYLIARGFWTVDQGRAYLKQQGYSDETAGYVLQVLSDRRVLKYRENIATTATAGYVRGDVDAAQLDQALSTSGLSQAEQSWAGLAANFQRSTHITHLTLGQIETGIKDGVMNFNDLKAWALRNNMPIEDELLTELVIQFDENKQSKAAAAKATAAKAKADAAAAKVAAAAQKAAQAKAAAPDRGISLANAEALVRSGDWTFQQLTAYLTAKGYGGDAIDAIETLLHQQIAKSSAAAGPAAGVRAAAKAKGLNLAQVEKAVVDGILQIADLQKWLSSQGFTDADASVIVQEAEHAAADARLRAANKAAAAAAAGKKSISLPALERAVRLGITPIDNYTAALERADFDPASIDLLVATLRAQIASDAAAKAGKGSTPTKPAVKAPTLAQIEQEVIAGVRPIADYTAELRAAGYAYTDAEQLTELVKAKADHAAHAAALHSDALGLATERGIGLASAEAAVLGGINTLDDYDAMLTRLGFDQADRDTLEQLLLAKAAAKASKTAPGSGQNPNAP